MLGLVMLAFAPATASAKARWFGFNDNSTIAHRLTPKQDAKLLARAGANAARITVDWSWVQYQRGGRFNFDFYDPIFRAWRARGIRPVLVVTGAPKWAWTPWVWCVASDCHFPPDRSHDADWQRFVAAVAQRFPSAVAIEVWNEPNL
ncbi:MAG: polysaccharide biosynthesis protein PslG, partial [Solirubrobacteraceae bacterium]|nr:polysaccharide biosynthesis protein PslG [Solirubrobacteraceae bacterium]